MTLNDFMSTLKTQSKVTVKNIDGDQIITFYSDGYTGVESDVLSRVVKRIDINSASAMTIIIADPGNSTNTEPDNNDPLPSGTSTP